MIHRNSSAGTAAQKSSKSSLMQRPAIILAMLLLCAVFCQGQDTTRIMILVADTTHRFDTHWESKECPDSIKNSFVICGKEVKEDKGNYGWGQCFWVVGYVVSVDKEEGYPPYQMQDGKKVIVGQSFRTYKTYYDRSWNKLPDTYYVWQSVRLK